MEHLYLFDYSSQRNAKRTRYERQDIHEVAFDYEFSPSSCGWRVYPGGIASRKGERTQACPCESLALRGAGYNLKKNKLLNLKGKLC